MFEFDVVIVSGSFIAAMNGVQLDSTYDVKRLGNVIMSELTLLARLGNKHNPNLIVSLQIC